MAKIPLSIADRRRTVAREADVLLRNRFVERNPVLSDNDPSFIARPGLEYWTQVGTDGPIRAIYHAAGAFDDDVFVVAYNDLYRVDRLTGAGTLVTAQLFGGGENLTVRMSATGDLGEIGPRLWIADGRSLLVYMEDGFATNVLTATVIEEGDIIRIGSVYYRMSNPATLDSGSPDGTSGNPWRVAMEASITAIYTNLFHAINDTGIPGTDYSTALVENPDAAAMQAVSNGLFVRAKAEGAAGNAVVTTTTPFGGSNIAWATGTMTGGGDPGVINVPTPDDVGVLDIGVLDQYVIVVPAQGEGINGRFYWINPGELFIDPLDYATAERSPDPIYQVIIFGDQFWLGGQSTTEPWFMTGTLEAPVAPLQGVVFDRGIQPGSAIQVRDSMVLIDATGSVIQIKGGERKISTPDIDERLRKAITYQNITLGG